MKHSALILGLVLTLVTSTATVLAENGVTDDEIAVGQVAVFEGPANALGLGMRAGLESCFNDVNAAGGVLGRKIKLVPRDDGYEPDKAIIGARALINDDGVFCLIGGVGTPTAKVIVPICEEANVPFVGAFTGAGLLRTPDLKYTINLRASYNQEMERIAQYLVEGKKFSKIACFYQNDAYGQAGLSGITEALKKRNMELAAVGTYERNTAAVKTGLLDVRKASPEAVVMVGTYKACAEFIKLAKRLGMKDTVYCNISFVGTRALQQELGANGEGVVISQVVPHPVSSATPVVKEYIAALKRNFPQQKPDWVSLEGYLVGKFFVQALEKAGKDVTRESLLAAIATTGTFDLGGLTLTYGQDDRQGLDKVYLTVIHGTDVEDLEGGRLAAK
ncbi:MAG: ABC transporter substrate-binding protein [Planctomycetes bacterium]|nr:ABC transporter substrate-binding protein [Planctomycetota bacterium]